MKKLIFIKNAAILTVSAIILRFSGIFFKIWLAAEIGSEGIGLYQMIFSFYLLVSSFAASGISTAVTRLVADELALGSKNGIINILKKSFRFTLIVAFLSAISVFSLSETVSFYIIGQKQAETAVKILSFSLPFMGISSCIRGYFIARRKASPTAYSLIFEQLVRIVAIVAFIGKFKANKNGNICSLLFFGDTLSEFAACFLLSVMFFKDIKQLDLLKGRINPPYDINKKIRHIALPMTSGRYFNSLLRTSENMLVPRILSDSGAFSGISQFGMIKGMALPVLFFPSAVLHSVSTMLVPEISEAAAKGRKLILKQLSEKTVVITSLVSFIFAGIFAVCGEKAGIFLFNSRETGLLLKILSPIVPLMYLDSISDGILKGLDQQKFCFRVSISDSILRLILIIAILPSYGMKGFIAIMYFSNFYTCFLNITRLVKICSAKIEIIKNILLPIAFSSFICNVCGYFLNMIKLSDLVYIILFTAISCSIYLSFLIIFKIITKNDILNIFTKK